MTRQEQKEARRQAILMKALELFVTKGYYETKINDIAEGVKMSVGLLFHYFDSKEQLFYELVKMGVIRRNLENFLRNSSLIHFSNNVLNLRQNSHGFFRCSCS